MVNPSYACTNKVLGSVQTPKDFFLNLDYYKVLLPEKSLPDHVLLQNSNRFNLSEVRRDPTKAYEG